MIDPMQRCFDPRSTEGEWAHGLVLRIRYQNKTALMPMSSEALDKMMSIFTSDRRPGARARRVGN